jgi:hypothetical protein
MKINEPFQKGDIVRALVSTDLDDPKAIREGNLYEIYTFPRHKNSGVVILIDKPAGNRLVDYSSTYFELVQRPEQ